MRLRITKALHRLFPVMHSYVIVGANSWASTMWLYCTGCEHLTRGDR